MAAVPVPPELWSEFDTGLDALMEGTKTAEKSYTEGKGISLASIAVGSAVMRLSKVRAMAESRDLQNTKSALEKATIKIREAAFTSSGDPEGTTLAQNLDTMEALMDVVKRMESPGSVKDVEKGNRDGARTRAAAAASKRKQNADGGGDAPDTANSSDWIQDNHAMEGWYEDLGIVEPDDNPLSCLVNEEDEAGSGRPKMCFFVAPVDPRLAEKERRLYWGRRGLGHPAKEPPLGSTEHGLPSTSLIGEGRQHARVLQEALRHLSTPPDEKRDAEEPPSSTSSSTTESKTSTQPSFQGGRTTNAKLAETLGKPLDNGDCTPVISEGIETREAAELSSPERESKRPTSVPDFETTETLRKQVQQSSKDDYWSRLGLAYTLEEQGECLATVGNFSASCSSYSEASEVGHNRKPPGTEVLETCVKLCAREQKPHGAAGENIGPGSCTDSVCYEAHLALAGELLARGGFERCAEVCGHILGTHDANDIEALFSLAQALEALGRSEEALKCAGVADLLNLAAYEG